MSNVYLALEQQIFDIPQLQPISHVQQPPPVDRALTALEAFRELCAGIRGRVENSKNK